MIDLFLVTQLMIPECYRWLKLWNIKGAVTISGHSEG